MKKPNVIFFIVVQIVSLALVYLFGAFNQVSFNIAYWTQEARDFVVIAAATLEFCIIPIPFMINFDKKP